jgi:hypothetical protein
MIIIFSYGKGLYLGNLTSLSPKSFFFRNVVIVLLKCRLSILERTTIFLEDSNGLEGCVD